MTELPNRALFMDRLRNAIRRAKRSEAYRLAVVFLDVDRFKIVNDSLGHTAGDELLKAIARRLEGCLRPGDTVARFGGDEFTMLLEDIGHAGQATKVAERVQMELAVPVPPAGAGGVRHREHGDRLRGIRLRAARRTCCATPTTPCTARSRWGAPATRCSTPPCTPTPWPRCAWRRSCAAPSSAASWSCTTSRSSPWPAGGWPASRRWCAGSTRSAGSSSRWSSSPWPRRRGSSSPSGNGCWARSAARSAPGPTTRTGRRRCR